MSLKNRGLAMRSCTFRKAGRIGFSALSLLAFAISAHATNLIVNGSFESITTGAKGPGQFDSAHPYTTVAGWASSGFNFVLGPGDADTTGSWSSEYTGYLKLWGPNDGSNNGLPSTSPDGGNYIGLDGAFEVGAITQTVSGLTAGNTYTLSFYWADAQQAGYTGTTTEQFKVTLGGVEQDTAIVDNVNHGFSGWQLQTFDFTANSTSELLSFLAVGTPTGVPPFALLDGVSLTADTVGTESAPEPGSVVLLVGGLMGLMGVCRLRRLFKS
jgi:hypothetical protein